MFLPNVFAGAWRAARHRSAVRVVALLLAGSSLAIAERQGIKRPEFGNYIALWRITNDPTAENQANYGIQSCWSPDGRHLFCTHRGVIPGRYSNEPQTGRQGTPVRRVSNKTTYVKRGSTMLTAP